MKNIPIFYGQVNKEGKIELTRQEDYEKYLAFQLAGKEIALSIEERKDSRSLQQNSFYWMYLGIIEKETGENANDLHEYFKRKLLPPRFVMIMKEEIKLPASTAKLDKADFTTYLDKISALTNVPVPNSEEWKFSLKNDIIKL